MKRQLATLGIAGRVGLSLLTDASSRTRLPLQKNSNVGTQPVSLVDRHCIAVVAVVAAAVAVVCCVIVVVVLSVVLSFYF